MKNLKYQREAHGMKQIELAERLGVCQSVISRWESETGAPPIKALPEIARIFNCSIDELFSQRTSPHAYSKERRYANTRTTRR